MSDENICSVVESTEGGYEAKALFVPVFTEADNLEDLRLAVRDGVECHFESDHRPGMIRLQFLRDKIIAL